MFEWKNKEVKEEEIEVRLNGMLGKNIWGVHHVVHYGLRQPSLPTFFVQEVLVSDYHAPQRKSIHVVFCVVPNLKPQHTLKRVTLSEQSYLWGVSQGGSKTFPKFFRALEKMHDIHCESIAPNLVLVYGF
jgi:hypothetical protein